jgi:succinate dehydrogenase / fumarate reductase cytochrome b subunit
MSGTLTTTKSVVLNPMKRRSVTTTQDPQSSSKRRLPWIVEIYKTDVGKKYAMAISGIILLSFIFFHMIGNLHTFEGAAELDEYGEALRDLGGELAPRTLVLWAFLRIPLAIAFIVHVHAAFAITRTNRRARGTAYEGRDYYAVTYASRTMIWSGIIILAFLAFHLADLTVGVGAVNPDFERGAVYENLVHSLDRPVVALLYIVAQAALAFHIWHGAWSLFQSLGVNNERFNRFRRTFATSLTIVTIVGFVAVPFAVQFGIVS